MGIAFAFFLLFLLIAAGIAAYGYRVYVRPGQLHERLASAAPTLQPPVAEISRPAGERLVRVIRQLGEKVPVSPQEARLVRRQLIAAGYRSDAAVPAYYGFKLACAGAGLVAGVFLRWYVTNPVLSLIVVPAAAAAGFFVPNIILDRLISRRQLVLRLSLPDALDLMVVCMEAGSGLDQAIANVSRELNNTHPEICQELGLITLEMRAGKRREEALRNLADRTGEAELRKLVATLIQADRFGTSMAEALRVHSDFLRVRRRQEAEEKAAKVGVKLIFPIFFFILPAIMVVVAGPGMIRLIEGLKQINR